MKDRIIALLKQDLVDRINKLHLIASQTQSDAANPELIQKSKYETQGIETGYLAEGHAKRLMELSSDLQRFHVFENKVSNKDDLILVGSLVGLKGDAGMEYYFISPVAALGSIEVDGRKIKVISESSPMGRELVGLSINDSVEIEILDRSESFIVREIH